ncbi:hypothetical protein SAMN05444273_101148 [Litoreibacter ascidiaceicola]|uniref:Uncharacterized protein n=1 Tax=Litoreibacter ascidiaceicola TaxID=1486859 RepID=A0A1M4SPT5_9RHOB|nr:hypothetical protein [Litoreibacter ascidiaceicola]SHE34182.1 hypothetical protein SAMN05444273_101148 [Litoreibacter ascidiaceicola]
MTTKANIIFRLFLDALLVGFSFPLVKSLSQAIEDDLTRFESIAPIALFSAGVNLLILDVFTSLEEKSTLFQQGKREPLSIFFMVLTVLAIYWLWLN